VGRCEFNLMCGEATALLQEAKLFGFEIFVITSNQDFP